jgi:HEAT repeat protein
LGELAAGLDAEQVRVRLRAVLAIAAVPTAEATTLLRRGLDDTDAAVRERSALALGSRQVSEAIPVLLAMVVTGRSDVEAAEVLGSLARATSGAGDLVRTMRSELGSTTDPAARLRITQALAEIPGPEARAALDDLTSDADRTVAATAASIIRARTRRLHGTR